MLKRWLIILLLVGIAAAGSWFWLGMRRPSAEVSWRMVSVETGDITATVGATGTLGAIRTVEVGTQVSGQIVELKADFNDRVRKGQLIARLDDTMLKQAALQAEAELKRAEADLDYKRYLLEQSETLSAQAQLSQNDLKSARLAVAQAEATHSSVVAGLDRARRNLDYTVIVAPINGVIIDRTVELGQTVAASLQAPKLFLIAEDLSHMQILAAVDESDISQVHVDQPVDFTVQAWPDRHFAGVVKQIRMQPSSSENVVNYTVVVETANPDGALMPGMTATLDFIVAKVGRVLTVPNAALRFKPSDEVLAALRQERQASKEGVQSGDSSARARQRGSGAQMAGSGDPHGAMSLRGPSSGRTQNAGVSRLWILNKQGQVRPLKVVTGLTDGQRTQVTGEGLAEGLEVIAGQVNATAPTSSSPFQTTRSSTSGPPRGGF